MVEEAVEWRNQGDALAYYNTASIGEHGRVAAYRTCGSNARNQYATATAPPSGVPIARSPR